MSAGHPIKSLKAACPQCGAATDLSAGNGWRPFCSERCKLIDLGAWASERYRVPAESGSSPDAVEPAGDEPLQ